MNQFFAALILACPTLTILSLTLPPPTAKAYIIAHITPATTNTKSCTPPTTNTPPTPNQRPSCTTVQHVGR